MFIPMAAHIYRIYRPYYGHWQGQLEEMRVYPLACPLNVVRYYTFPAMGVVILQSL